MIPQFGESFLDSPVQMAQENSDAMFRQNITKQVIDAGLEKADLEFQSKFYEDMWSKISQIKLQSRKNALTDERRSFAGSCRQKD